MPGFYTRGVDTSTDIDLPALALRIKALAGDFGFQRCGIADVELGEDEQHLRDCVRVAHESGIALPAAYAPPLDQDKRRVGNQHAAARRLGRSAMNSASPLRNPPCRASAPGTVTVKMPHAFRF